MADKNFIGFSTSADAKRVGRSWALYDVDLITRDLLNQFYTRKGERVMRPDYGCSIWDMIMDQMSTDITDEVEDEVRRICGLDSRVIVNSVSVYANNNQIVCQVTLTYRPSMTVQAFELTFDNRQEF